MTKCLIPFVETFTISGKFPVNDNKKLRGSSYPTGVRTKWILSESTWTRGSGKSKNFLRFKPFIDYTRG